MFAAIVGQSWATAAHPYNLEVNGVDHIGSVPGFGAPGATFGPPIHIEMGAPGTNGSMTFTIVDPDASVTVNEWDEVHFIEHAATRPILFGGFVQSVRYVAWATAGRDIIVTCMGYGVLLDRKVVDAFAPFWEYVADSVVSLINRFGGRITGTANGYRTTRNTYTTSTQHSVAYAYDWWWTIAPVNLAITSATMLRSVLDQWVEASSDLAQDPLLAQAVIPSTGMTYWVDGYARLHAHPTLDESFGAANENYDGDCPVAITEAVPSGSVVNHSGMDHERENSDLLTRVYMVGGNANGSGFENRGGHERAGDLEAIVNQPLSTSAILRRTFADGTIVATQASVARDSAVVESDAPIDFRPGQKLLVTSTPLGLSAQPFRITGVGITFRNSTNRVYSLSYGGALGKPSIAQRMGRYSRTARG